MLRSLAVALVAAITLAAAAQAVTPAKALGTKLKSEMQAFYTKQKTGTVITTVTCKIATGGKSARCQAHFTIKKERVVGVFQVAAAINTATGDVSTKTLSVSCKDSKTGAPVGC